MRYHVNGEIVPADDATVSVLDRGLGYGDGITERTRVFGGTVFEYEAHETRIGDRCDALSIPVPVGLRERIDGLLAANDLAEAVCQLSITRGGSPDLTPEMDASPTIVIRAESAPRGGRNRSNRPGNTNTDGNADADEEADRDGGTDGTETAAGEEPRVPFEPAVVQTVTIRRPDDPDPLTERVVQVRARLELARAATDEYRADEALVRDREGFLVGGAASDLLFADESALHVSTADPVDVLRPVVCDLAREEQIPIERGRYRPEQVRQAEEAFLASALDGLRPIDRIDGIAVGDGPVRKLLSATLDDLIERQYYAPFY